MSPQTVRNSHGRKQEIPANLTQKWQSSPRRAVRPQVRRPKTACERCRTAKVRCHGDGQRECDRCTSRRLPCRYEQMNPSPGPSSTPSSSAPDRTITREDVRMDADFSADNPYELAGDGDGDGALQEMLESSDAWPNTDYPADALEQQQQQQQNYMPVEWSTVDPAMTLDFSTALPNGPTPTLEQQQPSLQSLGLFPIMNTTSAGSLAWQDQLASQSCQCRAGLAQLMPNARAALRERRLGGVLRVTSDMLRQCESIVSCEACSVNCTDLICIMAVFQEVDGCFEYVARGNIDGAIKVTLGSYEVDIGAGDQDAQEFRKMLVKQLGRRADQLLDSISARGQDMLRQLDPGCRLGRVNINYLEAVIGNSRENLHNIVEALEETTTPE